jgi:transcriptional regulator with XRE-family HTH domain
MTEQRTKVDGSLKELGAVIKSVRKARRLSRAEFAASVGIAEKTVLNIEKGHGFTMESFLLILSYTALDRQLLSLFRSQVSDANSLI